METTILNAVLSENGIVAMLFILMLVWVYKLAKWFLAKYLDLSQEHNKSFLSSFDRMVDRVWILADNVIDWNKQHSDEHNKLMNIIWDRHDNNNLQHKKMMTLISENTDNIKETHNSIKSLHNKIEWKKLN